MCVICIKKLGEKFPSQEEIKNCADSNQDGFAMMWNENGLVHNFKTLDKDVFLKTYESFVKKHDYKKTALVIHARIKTHGSLKIDNCHCWLDLKNTIGFAHNGILSIQNRGDLTDSETYFRDIFVPIFSFANRDWKKMNNNIHAIIGTSKFAFLEGSGKVHHFGSFIQHNDNLFSNASYMPRKTYPIVPTFSYKDYEDDSIFYERHYDYRIQYYSMQKYMYIDSMRVERGDISYKRWELMCKYYFGEISENEYNTQVRTSIDAKNTSSTEKILNDTSIGHLENADDVTAYKFEFEDTMDWELFVLYSLGNISKFDYENYIKTHPYSI